MNVLQSVLIVGLLAVGVVPGEYRLAVILTLLLVAAAIGVFSVLHYPKCRRCGQTWKTRINDCQACSPGPEPLDGQHAHSLDFSGRVNREISDSHG